MPSINNLPEVSNITNADLFIIWDAETETTRKIKASSLKAYFGSSPITYPTTRIEAENYTAMFGVQTESCSEGGLNVGFIEVGDWMNYSITPPTSGNYRFTFRTASPNSGSQLRVISNTTTIATVSLPNTGGWQTWQSTQVSIPLNQGQQTIRIQSDTNGWNINWFDFTYEG